MHQNRNSMTPTIYDPIYWEAKHLLINLLNIEAYLQLIVIGLVIYLAVQTDVIRGRLEARFRTLRAASS